MPIHPHAISAATLRRRWRGYDRRQVQTLLHRLAQDYTAAIDTIAELSHHPAARSPADEAAGKPRASPPPGPGRDLPAAASRGPQAGSAEPARPQESTPAAQHASAIADAQAAAATHDRASARDVDNTRQPSAPPRSDDTTPSTLTPTACSARADPSDDQRIQRIQQIETELAHLRARLSLMERISQLEEELKALRSPEASAPDRGVR